MKLQDISVDIKTSSPVGVCSCSGAICMNEIMKKKLYKIRLQIDVFETCNKWPKWQDVPVDIKISPPRCCQPLSRGYIQIWPKWQKVSVDIKIWSPGDDYPWPAAIYSY